MVFSMISWSALSEDQFFFFSNSPKLSCGFNLSSLILESVIVVCVQLLVQFTCMSYNLPWLCICSCIRHQLHFLIVSL